jgi:Tfp pilus assembly protein PilN
MRPVNLLPASDRRHRVSARRLEKSSFVVLGVLGALLLGVLFYVSTANKITSDKSDIAKAKEKTRAAEARAQALGPFAQFAQVKETRVKSVQQLAEQRFDWERMMRETALVLPSGTSISTMDASTTGEGDSSTSGPAASSSSSGSSSSSATATGTGAPSMHLTGCAKSQPDVATLMVRLRALHDVDDVTLADSEKGETSSSSSSSSSGTTSSGSSDSASSGAADCTGLYKFDVTVTFKPAATGGDKGSDLKRVPGRLGGGA